MKHRSAQQMITDVLPELHDATDALLIITHADGTMGWHSMTDVLSRKLGMLKYVEICVDQAVRDSCVVDISAPVERVH